MIILGDDRSTADYPRTIRGGLTVAKYDHCVNFGEKVGGWCTLDGCDVTTAHVDFVENDENCRKDIDISLSIQLLCGDLEADARSFKPVVMRMKIPRGCMCRPCSFGVGVKPLEIADIQDKRDLWGTFYS